MYYDVPYLTTITIDGLGVLDNIIFNFSMLALVVVGMWVWTEYLKHYLFNSKFVTACLLSFAQISVTVLEVMFVKSLFIGSVFIGGALVSMFILVDIMLFKRKLVERIIRQ